MISGLPFYIVKSLDIKLKNVLVYQSNLERFHARKNRVCFVNKKVFLTIGKTECHCTYLNLDFSFATHIRLGHIDNKNEVRCERHTKGFHRVFASRLDVILSYRQRSTIIIMYSQV